jgi:23S rRNA pseudouridine2605 synthase
MRRAGGRARPVDSRAGRARAKHGTRPHTSARAEGPERLQKVLARAGIASRREAETWIRAGRLTINGAVATLGARVAPTDQLRLDGRLVHVRAAGGARVFLCHRSPGEPLGEPAAAAAPMLGALGLSGAQAVQRAPRRTAMLGRLPRRLGRRFIAVSPMPRADGGLELVTSDGELAARLQRRVHALISEFGVRVRGELSHTQLQGILGGELDSGAHLAVERVEAAGGEGANRWYTIAARGASGRQLRQLLERQGASVSRVLRTRLGPLALERSLARGRFRELSQEELRSLLSGAEAAEAAGEAAAEDAEDAAGG